MSKTTLEDRENQLKALVKNCTDTGIKHSLNHIGIIDRLGNIWYGYLKMIEDQKLNQSPRNIPGNDVVDELCIHAKQQTMSLEGNPTARWILVISSLEVAKEVHARDMSQEHGPELQRTVVERVNRTTDSWMDSLEQQASFID